jgi:protein-L-isoaspartate O-methyltransferase
VLNRQIDAQKTKLAQLEKGLAAATEKFGASDTRTLKWAQTVNEARSDLNRMESQLKKASNSMDDFERSTESADNAVGGFGKAAKAAGAAAVGAFAGGVIVGAIQNMISMVRDLVDATMEYNRIMASLEISSQHAGYTADQTTQTFTTLYGVLGDPQLAATAAANLQAIGYSQSDLTDITYAAIGAWSLYGDSIPIDGLAESVNETIKAGTVTGNFADVLNWAGVNEDEFNARLQAANSTTERSRIVMEELTRQGLIKAGQAWEENNKWLVAYNQEQLQSQQNMATFANMILPLVVSIQTAVNGLVSSILSIGTAFQEGGFEAAFIRAKDLATEFVNSFYENLPTIQQAGIDAMNNFITGMVENIPKIADAAGKAVTEFLNFSTGNAPKFIEEGGKTMGRFIEGVIAGIPDFVAELPQIISALSDFIDANLPAIGKAGGSILASIARGFAQAIPELIAQLPALFMEIGEAITSFNMPPDGTIFKAGKSIVQGLWEGISDMGAWLASKIRGFCSDFLGQILDFFGIQSPSRLMRDEVGTMLGRGIAAGLEDSVSTVRGVAAKVGGAIEEAIAPREVSAGFTATLSGVREGIMQNMQTPAAAFQNAAAGMVNGMQTLMAGIGGDLVIEIPVDGEAFYRATIRDFRRVNRANPEVVSGV